MPIPELPETPSLVEKTVPAVVAIDGPAGAGKSTVAQQLASRLGFFLLDTGAIYRSLAWVAREEGLPWSDEAALARRASVLKIDFVSSSAQADAANPRAQLVLVDGEDVTAAIRMPEISDGSSRVSAFPSVRAALLELQRSIARRGRCVVEGRDIGTVVLPWAPVKFFLTATTNERARRRHEELLARGQPSDLAATAREVIERDRRDEQREAAPLRRADDALLVDSTAAPVDEVVSRMELVVRERLAGLIEASPGPGRSGI